jgi:rubredoxin
VWAAAGGVGTLPGMTDWQPGAPAQAPPADATSEPYFTTTLCPDCGAEVTGLAGRYACPLCGWVNSWREGHGDLPAAGDDPDYPGPGRAVNPL